MSSNLLTAQEAAVLLKLIEAGIEAGAAKDLTAGELAAAESGAQRLHDTLPAYRLVV